MGRRRPSILPLRLRAIRGADEREDVMTSPGGTGGRMHTHMKRITVFSTGNSRATKTAYIAGLESAVIADREK